MAERRMIARKIIDTDIFLDMPITTRLLYYELNWRADDDGFVSSPKKILRSAGCSDDDLRILITKQFVIPFESGIVLIRDWKIHNYIRMDRYNETVYRDEKSTVMLDESNRYVSGIPTVDQRLTQVRLGKVSKGKDRLVEESEERGAETTENNDLFEKFYSCYPYKTKKPAAEKAFKKIKVNDSLFTAIMDGLEKWKQSDQWAKDRGAYIPHPSTWLNNRQWEDEIPKFKDATTQYTPEEMNAFEDDPGELLNRIGGAR